MWISYDLVRNQMNFKSTKKSYSAYSVTTVCQSNGEFKDLKKNLKLI